MDDMKIAAQLAEFACNAMQTAEKTAAFLKALTMLFFEKFKDEHTREMMMDFYAGGLEEQKKLGPGEKLTIISYDIHAAYAKQLRDICEREGIKTMHASTNTFDMVMDGKGDHVGLLKESVLIYGTQQKEFHLAVAEAKARSGYEQEIPREFANEFIGKVRKEKNPMLEVKGLPIERYIALRQDIQKLNPEMRFTLFPKTYEKNGKMFVDVGFLSKTEKLYDKKGNAYMEPKQYDNAMTMKGLIYKQNVIDRNPELTEYFDRIRKREEHKEETVAGLMARKPQTINTIEQAIRNSSMSEKDKEKILNMLQRYTPGNAVKESVIDEISNLSSIDEQTKNYLIRGINDLGKESYIIPAKVVVENGITHYEASLKDSICVGTDITVRSAGKEDLIISDERSMQDNLKRKITEFTEKGKTGEFTFVVLSADEFGKIEKGDPEYVGLKGRLRKKNINYLRNYDEKEYFNYNENQKSEIKKADEIIDKINAKKERFMLESDQDLTGIERFDEHRDAIVSEIITEQDHKEEMVSENEEIRNSEDKDDINSETMKDIEEIVIEPAADDFESYLEAEIGEMEEQEKEPKTLGLDIQAR